MDKFNKGQTVICEITVKDKDGTLVDPATSMNLTITDHQNGVEVNNQAMVKDSVGKYHYDFQTTSGNLSGVYTVLYTATDGSRITIKKDNFDLG